MAVNAMTLMVHGEAWVRATRVSRRDRGGTRRFTNAGP